MRHDIGKLNTTGLFLAWLIINILLTFLATFVVRIVDGFHVGAFGLYLFFGLVALVVVANLIFLIGTRNAFFRVLFGLSAAWTGLISASIGTMNTIDVLSNFKLLATYFTRLF